MNDSTIALIVAGGEGLRMGGELPKQYRSLAGKTVLSRSVEAFLRHSAIRDVCVVIHPDHEALYIKAVEAINILPPAYGGKTRVESVRNGLEHLARIGAPKHVLVHDAARCFVDTATISRVIAKLKTAQAVIPALPVTDTIKKVKDGKVIDTISRLNLYSIQTPQGFDFELLRNLHLNDPSEATDDAALAEAAGIVVECIAGNAHNTKLTTCEDWEKAQIMLAAQAETRIGMGYDVHRLILSNGKPIHLCGLALEHSETLEGHSDADVGLHALVDAIFGALAIGDIGSHFPPSDAKWKNVDSALFVHHAAEKMRERGASLINADITLICEAPKISPHRDAMRTRVAELLNVSVDRISIKATTSEKLGFTGRGEGIAAQAVVSLRVAP